MTLSGWHSLIFVRWSFLRQFQGDFGCSLAARGQENCALVDHHIRVAISPRIPAAACCTTTFSDPSNAASDGSGVIEFLLFGFQSAVIFLNIFFDLICDPKKF
jgi:hypothetical protein